MLRRVVGPVGVEMAEVVRRLGGEAVLVEGGDHVLPRGPAPLGEALGEARAGHGIELMLGMHCHRRGREGDEYRPAVRWRYGRAALLAARGNRSASTRRGDLLETVGVEADPHGIPVDEHLARWRTPLAVGDVNGIWPLTHVGEYEGDVVAANIAR